MASSSSTTFKDLNFVTSDTDNEDEAPLPAPMTTRNRIPRSRATSLARSRGSSRASSVSGSRNGSRAASRTGSVRGSRPGSRAGLVDLVDSALGSGSRMTGGLVWQQGGDMGSTNDELGYVGAGSSSAAGPSGYGQWKTEDEHIPLSNKAKGKKRARSTPEEGDDGGVRTKARMASPQGEEQPAPYNHEYALFPSTFSFITQTQPEEPPQTQLSSSVGSSTLASTATLGSFNPGISFSQYDLPGDLLDFTENAGAQHDSSAFSDVSFQGSAVSSTRAQAGSFVFGAGTPYEPDFAGSSASGSSSSGRTNDTGGGGAVVGGIGSPSAQATSSTSSSSPAQAGASGSSLPSAPIVPSSSSLPILRNPTPPPQPDLLSSYTCPICFFPPTNATLTPCGHICCGSCLFTAIKSSQSRSGLALMSSAYANQGEALCPVCRATIAGWDGKGGGVIGLRVRSVISI